MSLENLPDFLSVPTCRKATASGEPVASPVPPFSNMGALLHKKLTKTHTIPKLWNGIRSFNKIRIITMLEVRFTSIFYQKWRNGGQNGTKGIYTVIKKQTTCQRAFTRTACRTSAYIKIQYQPFWKRKGKCRKGNTEPYSPLSELLHQRKTVLSPDWLSVCTLSHNRRKTGHS